MKRSPLKPGAGLKRTAFARGERKEAAASGKIARGMNPKRPKMTPIRASARGEQCTLRFPCCNFDPSTTVWCHSNHYADGKGAGLKARDEEGCYGCFACHSWLDGGYAGHMPRTLVDRYFDIARAMSQTILQHKGLMATTKSEATTGLQPAAASIKTIHGEQF
jgi:hypothetical protein